MPSVTNVFSVTRVFETIDEMEADEYASYFAEDASFRFGNAAPILGRQTIRDAMVVFFSTIKGLHHEVVGVWEGEWERGDVYSVETEVTYTRKDDAVVSNLPAHRGQQADSTAATAFIAGAPAHLRAGGAAWFVANKALPYELPAARAFRRVRVAAADGRYKVLHCEDPVGERHR
jgi:hypothetical protein